MFRAKRAGSSSYLFGLSGKQVLNCTTVCVILLLEEDSVSLAGFTQLSLLTDPPFDFGPSCVKSHKS